MLAAQIVGVSLLCAVLLVPSLRAEEKMDNGLMGSTTSLPLIQDQGLKTAMNKVGYEGGYMSQTELYGGHLPNPEPISKTYVPEIVSRNYNNYQSAPADDEEEYHQAMQSAGLRPSSQSYSFAPSVNPYTMYMTSPTGSQENMQRISHQMSEEMKQQNLKPSDNFLPPMYEGGTKMSSSFENIDGGFSNFPPPSSPSSSSSSQPQNMMFSSFGGSSGGFGKDNIYIATPIQGFTGNNNNQGGIRSSGLDGNKQPSGKFPSTSNSFVPMMASGMMGNQGSQVPASLFSNSFVPAIAFAHPINFGGNFNQLPKKQQQFSGRPMMGNQFSIPINPSMMNNGGGNGGLMGASTLTMPMFLAPNMGMNGMNRMNYPGAFSPMIYPSPMFIPTVNPYSPFFPPGRTNKDKQRNKTKSENRDDKDDRDDNEDLFEDDSADQEGDE